MKKFLLFLVVCFVLFAFTGCMSVEGLEEKEFITTRGMLQFIDLGTYPNGFHATMVAHVLTEWNVVCFSPSGDITELFCLPIDQVTIPKE